MKPTPESERRLRAALEWAAVGADTGPEAAVAGALAGLSLQAATPAVRPASAAVLMKRRRPMPTVSVVTSLLLLMVHLFRIGSEKTGGLAPVEARL